MIIRNCLELLTELGKLEEKIKERQAFLKKQNLEIDEDKILLDLIKYQLKQHWTGRDLETKAYYIIGLLKRLRLKSQNPNF